MNLETSGMNPEQSMEGLIPTEEKNDKEGLENKINPEKVTEVTEQIRTVLDDFKKETMEFLDQNREVSTATNPNMEHIVNQYFEKAMGRVERIISRELN